VGQGLRLGEAGRHLHQLCVARLALPDRRADNEQGHRNERKESLGDLHLLGGVFGAEREVAGDGSPGPDRAHDE
jgi:hypothetical protein